MMVLPEVGSTVLESSGSELVEGAVAVDVPVDDVAPGPALLSAEAELADSATVPPSAPELSNPQATVVAHSSTAQRDVSDRGNARRRDTMGS